MNNFTFSENKNYLFLLLIFGLLIGTVSLIYPFGRDQGIYSYIGKLILDGKIDYKYSYNLRQPGIHYIFAIGQLLTGKGFFGMRLFDLFWQVGTAYIIYILIFKLSGNKIISLISSVLYIFLYYRLSYWHTLQTESFMNLITCLMILMIMKDNVKYNYFISGIFYALLVLFKVTVVVIGPFILIAIYFRYRQNINSFARNIIQFFLGLIVPIAIVILIYALSNALNEFAEIQFVQIPMYAKIGYMTESTGFILKNIIKLFLFSVYTPFIWMSILFFIMIFKKKDFNHLLIFFWLVSSLIILIMQIKFFYYHFLIIIPPALISSGLFINLLLPKLRKFKFSYALGSILFLSFVVYSGHSYTEKYSVLINYISGKTDIKQVYQDVGTTSDSVYTITKINYLTDRVVSMTEEKDKIYIWGIEPIIYYLSERDCISRFTYNTPFYWKFGGIDYKSEFLNEINKNLPKLVLVARNDAMYTITGVKDDSEQMLNKFEELNNIINERYNLIEDKYDFKIYKLM